jgi:hypothetical protein
MFVGDPQVIVLASERCDNAQNIALATNTAPRKRALTCMGNPFTKERKRRLQDTQTFCFSGCCLGQTKLQEPFCADRTARGVSILARATVRRPAAGMANSDFVFSAARSVPLALPVLFFAT